MKVFINKYKERIALGGMAVAFVFFVSGGILMNKYYHREKTAPANNVETSVELRQSSHAGQATGAGGAMTAFFLKPSAGELLEELAEMENLNQDVIDSKFLNLRVLWPAYFFAASALEGGKTRLLLDVSDDGFGVQIESEVSGALYPEITSLETGDPLWIAGEILAVDPAGTGTVYLKCEYLSFGSEAPLSHHQQESMGRGAKE